MCPQMFDTLADVLHPCVGFFVLYCFVLKSIVQVIKYNLMYNVQCSFNITHDASKILPIYMYYMRSCGANVGPTKVLYLLKLKFWTNVGPMSAIQQ